MKEKEYFAIETHLDQDELNLISREKFDIYKKPHRTYERFYLLNAQEFEKWKDQKAVEIENLKSHVEELTGKKEKVIFNFRIKDSAIRVEFDLRDNKLYDQFGDYVGEFEILTESEEVQAGELEP